MAKAISSDELQLRKRARRRLVGAIALVLIVVVFVPMFLENEPKPLSQDVAIHIPQLTENEDGDEAPASTLRFTPAEAPEPGQTGSGSAAPEPEPGPSETPAEVPVAQQEQAAQTKPIALPTTEPKPKPVAAKEEFVVQLGAFSDAANAARLAAKVRASRFDAYTEVVTTPSGKRTRVRVGPFDSRAEAEQARDRLKARKLTYGEPSVMRR